MEDKRKLMFQSYFEVFYLIVGAGELITIEDPLLSVHGYQLLPLATSYLAGNNRELDVSEHILRCFIHCWWR